MIEVNNLTSVDIDGAFLKRVVREVLKAEKIKGKIQLSIALLGPTRMRKLNSEYRHKNRVTDVLAFPESETFFKKFKGRVGQPVFCKIGGERYFFGVVELPFKDDPCKENCSEQRSYNTHHQGCCETFDWS